MTETHWHRMWELFHQALEVPSDQRSEFLSKACADEHAMRSEILGLIDAYESSSLLLEDPLLISSDADTLLASAGVEDHVIEGYQLLERIGEGGMGSVFLAEQLKPVRRRVALKVIKIGMDTKEVIGRFEAERQALAMMNHPNIAQVYDGGATDDGRPFFAMEYVAGISINEYCDQYRLSTKQRLELFVKVCDAVQHAHQKSVIHRDIKPSNILVSMQSGKPVPKVIDFGVAKAIAQRLAEHTVYTEIGRFIGTPAYTSPEQAKLTGLDVDTRTDIYSLGVLLYELLTGRLPFETTTLLKDGYAGMQRIIQESDPPKPSDRISRLSHDETRKFARAHGSNARNIERELRGDLDWIAMKAMEKDRTRRYDSASELSADIKRHLAKQPIVAGPPSASYRISKFVSRHRAGVAFTAALATILVVATTVASTGWMRARESQARAATAAAKAETVNEFLLDMLAAAAPSVALGRDTTVLREMVDNAAARIESDRSIAPDVEAAIRQTIGDTYLSLGLPQLAEPHLTVAMELLDNESDDHALEIAQALFSLGKLAEKIGNFTKAEERFREAIRIYQDIQSREPQAEGAMADAIVGLTWLLIAKGEYDEADRQGKQALAIRVAADNPQDIDKLVEAHSILGMLNRRTEHFDASQDYYEEALKLARRLDSRHPALAMTLNNYGLMLVYKEEYERAEALLSESLELRRQILPERHPDLAESLNNLAIVFVKQERYPEAEGHYRESLDIVQAVQGERHPHVATLYYNIAEIKQDQAQFSEAARLYQDALSIDREHYPDDHSYVMRGMVRVGKSLLRAGDPSSAMRWLQDAIRLMEENIENNHWRLADARAEYATALTDLRRYAEAEPVLLAAYSALQESDPDDSRGLIGPTRDKLIRLYTESEQITKLEALRGQHPE